MFALFSDINEFEAWHESILLKLGYPIVGQNQKTGEFDEENLTTDFTTPITNAKDIRVIAYVDNQTDGLNLIDADAPEWSDWFPKFISAQES